MYEITSLPFVRRTFATFRMAEFGFFGVRVMTCTQTPRRKGLPSNAGDFDLVTTLRRPLRTSWLIVGIRDRKTYEWKVTKRGRRYFALKARQELSSEKCDVSRNPDDVAVSRVKSVHRWKPTTRVSDEKEGAALACRRRSQARTRRSVENFRGGHRVTPRDVRGVHRQTHVSRARPDSIAAKKNARSKERA